VSSSYIRVRLRIAPEAEDNLAAILGEAGALGAQVESDAVDDATGQRLLDVSVWADPAELPSLDGLLGAVAPLAVSGPWVVEEASQDWLATFRESARPFAVGESWWIDPSPSDPTSPPSGRTQLVIEPRMAFGTGDHESTRLALEELETLHLRGCRVLDIGTGSSILALAAVIRGASPVVGCDIDAQAVFVARQIVAQQVAVRKAPALIVGGVTALSGRFDVVLCNMIPAHWAPFASQLPRLLVPGGELVVSGLLDEHRQEVEGTVVGLGLEPVRWRQMNEWCCLTARLC
jgi:ribosomal protein L11 methyltransferase